MEITINLNDVVVFESRGETFKLAWADVPQEKLASFVATAAEAGIMKAGVDAAASAKKYAEDNDMGEAAATRLLVEKRMDAWRAGEWTHTTRGAGFTSGEGAAVDAKLIGLLRPYIKNEDEKWYKAATEPERKRRMAEVWADFDDDHREGYLRIARRQVERDAEDAAALAAINTPL